ncbi:MAG: vitamin B12-dependent ribonucleotide reductase [bacterium]|jgi:ribonucleoside-diphosphate reductase alpha chain
MRCPGGGEKLQLTSNALTVLERRYLKKKDGKVIETPENMLRRVAVNIAAVEREIYGKDDAAVQAVAEEFYAAMDNLDFLPNSPTLMNAGRELQQLSACFVLPIEDSMESIFDSIKHAALIHKSGGGTGFAFSRIRPRNDQVLTTGGVASGPISFMKVFNAATDAVKQGGTRRGANMGILRVDHPDIVSFITCKRDNQEITNFNISVGITEEFMQAVADNREYELVNPRTGASAGKLPARQVYDLLVEQAWQNGEPGIIFLDRMNKDNPTPQLGEIESTNPCGEQPLLPYESCNLGSVNLARMVRTKGRKTEIDYPKLRRTVRMAVRFLDDVIDANSYPLPMIDEMTKGNRKIGLGVMGFADLLILLGIPYDSEEAVEMAEKIMRFIDTEAKKMSGELAAERGVFPNFTGSIYDRQGGPRLRNATVTTIAPTGTISIIAGVSSGVEPLFAVAYTRTVLDNDTLTEIHPLFEAAAQRGNFYTPEIMAKVGQTGNVQDIAEIPSAVRRLFVTAHDISPEWHIRMQAAFQKYTDNAVSKTVNFSHSAKPEDIREVFRLAYELGCKGVTVYRDGSRESQVLSTPATKDAVKSGITFKPRPRPYVTIGMTEKVKIGCGNLYINVNSDDQGICEVFTTPGRHGGCASQSEATSRLISIALRSGIPAEVITEQLRGIRCPACVRREGIRVTSCPDAIGRSIQKYIEHEQNGRLRPEAAAAQLIAAEEAQRSRIAPPRVNACPECGNPITYESGCVTCPSCGYSKCG